MIPGRPLKQAHFTYRVKRKNKEAAPIVVEPEPTWKDRLIHNIRYAVERIKYGLRYKGE